MGLQNFLNHKPLELVDMLTDNLAELAAKMHVQEMVLYILAAVSAVLIGFVGLHMVKALSMISLGAIGYLVGVELFHWMQTGIKGLDAMPDFLVYVFGAVLAILFFIFGWKKCLPAMFVLFGLVGYNLVVSYVPNANVWLGIGGFVLLAMLASLIFKVAFIALTSAIGGFCLTGLLGVMLPDVQYLQLGSEPIAVWVATGVAVVMLLFQLLTTMHYSFSKK